MNFHFFTKSRLDSLMYSFSSIGVMNEQLAVGLLNSIDDIRSRVYEFLNPDANYVEYLPPVLVAPVAAAPVNAAPVAAASQQFAAQPVVPTVPIGEQSASVNDRCVSSSS